MPNPQQAELRRSGENATNERHTRTMLSPEGPSGNPTDPSAVVPEENEPGHHPDVEQDKPDATEFARRFGIGAGAPDHNA